MVFPDVFHNPEMQEFMKHLDPLYRQGLEEGFNIARNIIAQNLREKVKEYESLQAYVESTSTVSIKIKRKS